MRMVHALLGLTVLTGLAGCAPEGSRFNLLRSTGGNVTTVPVDTTTPATADLVAYLNNNSAKIPGIESKGITLTCYNYNISKLGIDLGGRLCAQGPRNFRMNADFLGKTEVDLGSNTNEFWYWISKGDPYQVFCSYQAIEEGRVKQMPFPFQPDWVLEAMGMGRYGPAEKYEQLVVEGDKLKLIEKTKSPQGVPVKKVIVFNKNLAKSKEDPQITDFLLLDDATNRVICSAHITRRQILPPQGAELPRELVLEWPEQKMKLVLHLSGIQLSQDFRPQVFVRAPLRGVPSYDLAAGRVEALQQAGGAKGIRN